MLVILSIYFLVNRDAKYTLSSKRHTHPSADAEQIVEARLGNREKQRHAKERRGTKLFETKGVFEKSPICCTIDRMSGLLECNRRVGLRTILIKLLRPCFVFEN